MSLGMMSIWMLLTGCRSEPLLLPVSDCSDESWNAHHSFYDKRTYAWTLTCSGDPDQSGQFRVGAVLKTDSVPLLAAGVPCSKAVHGQCDQHAAGMRGNINARQGDRPAGGDYRYICGEPSPSLALFFRRPDSTVIRCDHTGACFTADAAAAPVTSCALALRLARETD